MKENQPINFLVVDWSLLTISLGNGYGNLILSQKFRCLCGNVTHKDLLMTRGIIEENICELCGRESETIIHVLHDYNGSECSIFLDVDTAFCTLYNLGPR